ncbi:unnamed protein product [Phytophthora fragariaefolia]|uniref:Unnamed protein product n=1 Tax=Phytophthora fragariaefolia TaxID=1490495 RepID=A0A9W6XY97_9STRA|nr:unnamed protein product [Phytophthora fragariaefolia]
MHEPSILGSRALTTAPQETLKPAEAARTLAIGLPVEEEAIITRHELPLDKVVEVRDIPLVASTAIAEVP